MAFRQIAEHLCFVCNLPFTTGIFPDSLKIAKVTPVYKKGSKLECANYRPITLLSKGSIQKTIWISKIFSTAHAVISLIENIEKAI